MSDLNLQEIHDTLISVAFEAGRMMLAANPNDVSQGEKLNSVDIVTEVDQAVEKMVTARLKEAYPTFAFVGEETYEKGVTKVTAAPTFIVDPIDGTLNFIHGLPWACISLGFAVDRVPTVGVVFNPFLDHLFTGIRGRGSFLQRNAALAHGAAASGAPLPAGFAPRLRLPLRRGEGAEAAAGAAGTPPPLTGLGTAMVVVEWGSDRDGANFELKARVFRELVASKQAGGRMSHALRSLGSAALSTCTVAAGQLDGYWEGGCYAWDVAAAWCILVEAGGRMVGGNPGEWDTPLDSRKYFSVRGAPSGQEELVQELWDVIGDAKMVYEH